MVLDRKHLLDTWAQKVLDQLYAEGDAGSIHLQLGASDETWKAASQENFRTHYTCAKLALVCHAWERSCADNGRTDERVQKLILKRVLASFESEKTIPVAELFSQYLCLASPEGSPEIVAMAEFLFEKLGMKAIAPDAQGKPSIRKSFQQLVSLLEAHKSRWENQFFEFLIQYDASAGKKS